MRESSVGVVAAVFGLLIFPGFNLSTAPQTKPEAEARANVSDAANRES